MTGGSIQGIFGILKKIVTGCLVTSFTHTDIQITINKHVLQKHILIHKLTQIHKFNQFLTIFFTHKLLNTAAKFLLKLTPFTRISIKFIILNTFNTESKSNYKS